MQLLTQGCTRQGSGFEGVSELLGSVRGFRREANSFVPWSRPLLQSGENGAVIFSQSLKSSAARQLLRDECLNSAKFYGSRESDRVWRLCGSSEGVR